MVKIRFIISQSSKTTTIQIQNNVIDYKIIREIIKEHKTLLPQFENKKIQILYFHQIKQQWFFMYQGNDSYTIQNQEVQVKLRSIQYLKNLQKLIKKINQVESAYNKISQSNNNLHIDNSKPFLIKFLWAAPLFPQNLKEIRINKMISEYTINTKLKQTLSLQKAESSDVTKKRSRQSNNQKDKVLQYFAHYEQYYYEILSVFQKAKKKVKISIDELNYINLTGPESQPIKITYIMALAEKYPTQFLFAQRRDGALQKIQLETLPTFQNQEKSDLLILHLSFTDGLYKKIQKNYKNIILINSNVVYSDACTTIFFRQFFTAISQNKSIKQAYNIAIEIIQSNSEPKLKKFSCCCYHNHTNKCIIIKKKRQNSFAGFHYRYHNPRCNCKNRNLLLHSENCQQLKQQYLQKQRTNQTFYCCCQPIELNEELHSLRSKFKLVKEDKEVIKFELTRGQLMSDVSSQTYQKSIKLGKIMKSRIQLIRQMMLYINTQQANNRPNIINIHGEMSVGKKFLAQYFAIMLMKKKLIKNYWLYTLQEYNIQKSKIENQRYLIILKDVDNTRIQVQEKNYVSKIFDTFPKIIFICLTTNQKKFHLLESQSIQLKQFTPDDAQLYVKLNISLTENQKKDLKTLRNMKKLKLNPRELDQEIKLMKQQGFKNYFEHKKSKITEKKQQLDDPQLFCIMILISLINEISQENLQQLIQMLKFKNLKFEDLHNKYNKYFKISNKIFKLNDQNIKIEACKYEQYLKQIYFLILLLKNSLYSNSKSSDISKLKYRNLFDITSRNSFSLIRHCLNQHQILDNKLKFENHHVQYFFKKISMDNNWELFKSNSEDYVNFFFLFIFFIEIQMNRQQEQRNQPIRISNSHHHHQKKIQAKTMIEKFQEHSNNSQNPQYIIILYLLQIQIYFNQKNQTKVIQQAIQMKIQQIKKKIPCLYNYTQRLIIVFDIILAYILMFSFSIQPTDLYNRLQQDLKSFFRKYNAIKEDIKKNSDIQKQQKQQKQEIEAILQDHAFKECYMKLLVKPFQLNLVFSQQSQKVKILQKLQAQNMSIYYHFLKAKNQFKSKIHQNELRKYIYQYDQIKKLIPEENKKKLSKNYQNIITGQLHKLCIQINKYSSKTCIILSSFPLQNQNKRDYHTKNYNIMLEFDLEKKLKQIIEIKQKEPQLIIEYETFNLENFDKALKSGCKYLCLWIQYQNVNNLKSIITEKNEREQEINIEQFAKRIIKNPYGTNIKNLIICYPKGNLANLIIEIQKTTQIIENIIYFEFKEFTQSNKLYNQAKVPHQKQNFEQYQKGYHYYLRKIIMLKFTENYIRLYEKYQHSNFFNKMIESFKDQFKKYFYKGQPFENINIEDQVKKKSIYQSQDCLNIQINWLKTFTHNLYICSYKQLVEIIKKLKDNLEWNLQKGGKQVIGSKSTIPIIKESTNEKGFTTYLSNILKRKEIFKQVYQVNFAENNKQQQLIQFIQRKIGKSLILLKNTPNLLILENFHLVYEKKEKYKTYQYLIQVLMNEKKKISTLVTISKQKDIKSQFSSNIKDQIYINYKRIHHDEIIPLETFKEKIK